MRAFQIPGDFPVEVAQALSLADELCLLRSDLVTTLQRSRQLPVAAFPPHPRGSPLARVLTSAFYYLSAEGRIDLIASRSLTLAPWLCNPCRGCPARFIDSLASRELTCCPRRLDRLFRLAPLAPFTVFATGRTRRGEANR